MTKKKRPEKKDDLLEKGYQKQPMSPTEPMYSDEDHTGFYDNVGGFVERNNYLDRL